jgi:ribose transport system ATP-binding protein
VTATAASETLLSIRGLRKSFGDTQVLKGVDFDLVAGEVHGLLGANGAGKSTLVRHLSGYYTPTSSDSVQVRGHSAHWPLDAGQYHVATVHQEQAFCDTMTVLENCLAHRLGVAPGLRPISWRRARLEVRAAVERVGLKVGLDWDVARLSPGERALLAMARALMQVDPSVGTILILDEPTAVLGPDDANDVLMRAAEVAKDGGGVILVTHRLEEMRAVASRVAILREGTFVFDGPMDESNARVEELMFTLPDGRSADPPGAPQPVASPSGGPGRLSVVAVKGQPLERPIVLAAGEVVGVTGLRGAGHEELAHEIVGGLSPAATIELDGRTLTLTPRSAAQAGVVLVSGNRQREALWLAGSVFENLTTVRRDGRHGRLRPGTERQWVRDATAQAGVTPNDVDRLVSTFSGGNQQKISMARWLSAPGVRVMLVHEPTQGIDLHARRQILTHLRAMARERDVAVAVFSSDYEALAAVSDRVLVVRAGQVETELTDSITEDRIEAATLFSTPAIAH